jgi:hypothetical protein
MPRRPKNHPVSLKYDVSHALKARFQRACALTEQTEVAIIRALMEGYAEEIETQEREAKCSNGSKRVATAVKSS